MAEEAIVTKPAGKLGGIRSKLLLSVVFGAGIGWVLLRGGLPLVPARAAFDGVAPWAVPAYVLTLLGVHVLRAMRWRHLLRPVGHVAPRHVLAVSWIAFGAILVAPLRAGEIVRPLLVTERGDVELWEATGTIGAERVIDGVFLSVILFVALTLASPLSPLPDHVGALRVPASAVPHAAYVALAVFFTAFTAMAVFYRARALALRITHVVLAPLSARLAERAGSILSRLADGLRFLPSARHTAPFLAETAGYWALNAFGVWLLAAGAGLPEVTLPAACIIMGSIGIGILVPAGPAYFGAFQLSTYMALAMFVPETAILHQGAAFVFLLYASQVVVHLAAAGAGLILNRV